MRTYEEIRQELLDMQFPPFQWIVLLECVEDEVEDHGFDSLADFLTATLVDGGLQLTLEKAKTLLYYNADYKHKADRLALKLGLAETAKAVEPVQVNGGYVRTEETKAKQSAAMTPGIMFDKSKNIKHDLARKDGGGTAAAYRIGLLKRDHPAVAARLEAGEFKNVAEAERAAGVKEPKRNTQRCSFDLDNREDTLRLLIEKYLPEFELTRK